MRGAHPRLPGHRHVDREDLNSIARFPKQDQYWPVRENLNLDPHWGLIWEYLVANHERALAGSAWVVWLLSQALEVKQ